jgi:hypothetical protein
MKASEIKKGKHYKVIDIQGGGIVRVRGTVEIPNFRREGSKRGSTYGRLRSTPAP